MKNILVGIDFHERTSYLVEKAFEWMKPYDAKIWLLHATAPEPDFVGYAVGPEYIRDFRAKEIRNEHKLLSSFVDKLKAMGAVADGLLVQGNTIDVVLEESKKLNIDLIIFGHHEHSLLYKIFFGSHASEIIQKSAIPVLVVPFGD
ncbi:MAG: universal stress protein [Bacteroidales bacterium]|nr:universal stress protein [Bacteroidales bacterium]